VFIGYSPIHKGFKCLDVPTGRVYISRDVIFDENVFPIAKLHSDVGARFKSEVLLLPPALLNPEISVQGSKIITDQVTNASNRVHDVSNNSCLGSAPSSAENRHEIAVEEGEGVCTNYDDDPGATVVPPLAEGTGKSPSGSNLRSSATDPGESPACRDPGALAWYRDDTQGGTSAHCAQDRGNFTNQPRVETSSPASQLPRSSTENAPASGSASIDVPAQPTAST
jgi:hypothetical protein